MKLTGKIRTLSRPARHWALAQAMDLLFWTLGRLPEERAIRLGAWFGGMGYGLDARNRRLTLKHLEDAYGSEMDAAQRRRVAREVYRNLGRSTAENAHAVRKGVDFIKRRFTFEGEERLIESYRRGKGVVIVTAHLDNWEMAGSAVARLLDLPVVTVARPQSDEVFERRLSALRARMGLQVHSRGDDARSLLRHLRDGKVLTVLLDQDTDGTGCFVPFFGRPAFTLTGPAMLALRAGAPMIAGFSRRQPDNVTHAIGFCGPILPPESGDRKADACEMTRQATEAIERAVRQSPEQWVWFHRRWKAQAPQTETNEAK